MIYQFHILYLFISWEVIRTGICGFETRDDHPFPAIVLTTDTHAVFELHPDTFCTDTHCLRD